MEGAAEVAGRPGCRESAPAAMESLDFVAAGVTGLVKNLVSAPAT
jgi:hypothetical protein